MGITGKYKIIKIMTITENGPTMVPIEDYLKASVSDEHQKKERENVASSIVEINEDGLIYLLTKIPDAVTKEMIDQAVSAGQIKLHGDRYMVAGRTYEWKEENGIFKYDTHQERKLLNEEVSSWDDLKFDGQTIAFSDGMLIYGKMED